MNDRKPTDDAFQGGSSAWAEMASQWFNQVARVLPSPPDWLVLEGQQRVLLLINHVLQQEPEAMSRLQRHAGQHIAVQWRNWRVQVMITPAGLLDLDRLASAAPDLSVQVVSASALEVVQTVLKGAQPQVRIDGDVQLAAQVNWLTQYVRWDIEEDLSRVIGDAPAHQLVKLAKQIAGGFKSFVDRAAQPPSSSTPPDSAHTASPETSFVAGNQPHQANPMVGPH